MPGGTKMKQDQSQQLQTAAQDCQKAMESEITTLPAFEGVYLQGMNLNWMVELRRSIAHK
jgi:hypothetical protein